MIKSVVLVQPHGALLTASGKLRSLIAVLALGAILLLVVISVADVLQKRRRAASIDADIPAKARLGVAELKRGDWDGAQPCGREESRPGRRDPLLVPGER